MYEIKDIESDHVKSISSGKRIGPCRLANNQMLKIEPLMTHDVHESSFADSVKDRAVT